jgi:hypothetical protein
VYAFSKNMNICINIPFSRKNRTDLLVCSFFIFGVFCCEFLIKIRQNIEIVKLNTFIETLKYNKFVQFTQKAHKIFILLNLILTKQKTADIILHILYAFVV